MQNQPNANAHIVFFTPELPPSFAGAGINAQAFARYISNFVQKITLCSLNYNNTLPKTELREHLIIKRLPYYNKNILLKFFSFPLLLFHYYKNIRQADIVFIYSGYLIGFQFIVYVSSLLHRKVVFRSTLIGGDDPNSLLSKNLLIRKLNKFILKRITVYFAINPVFATQFSTAFGNQIRIVETYQGIDSGRFHPFTAEHKIQIREKLQLPPNTLIILSVGILLKKKGFHMVFEQLTKLNIPFKYIVAGDYSPSPYHNLSVKEKKEMVTLLNRGTDILGNKIEFVGSVDNIEEYYHAADIFLIPSQQEGTPNALLEAMACGLPCITSQLEGISGDLTLHSLNCLEFNTEDEIPQLIQSLAENPGRMSRLGIKAAETIAESYTFDKVATKLLSSING